MTTPRCTVTSLTSSGKASVINQNRRICIANTAVLLCNHGVFGLRIATNRNLANAKQSSHTALLWHCPANYPKSVIRAQTDCSRFFTDLQGVSSCMRGYTLIIRKLTKNLHVALFLTLFVNFCQNNFDFQRVNCIFATCLKHFTLKFMKNSLISCFPESSYRASWICKWHVALLSMLLFAQSNACAQMDYEISYDMSDFSLIDSLGITSIRCNDALTRTAFGIKKTNEYLLSDALFLDNLS